MRSKNALGLIFGILMTVVCATASFAQPAGTRNLGCFKDTYDRDLTGYAQQDAQLTLQSCASICRQKGFKYAAAQNGNQCFCGNSYGKHGKATNCDTKCAGNSNEICGGSWANSLYELILPGVTGSGDRDLSGVTGIGVGKGCYKDNEDRDLTGYSFWDGQMNLQLCADRCRQKGFKYAAAQNGNQCFCGNSFGKYGESKDCYVRCAGNSNEICGGPWANNIYDVSTGSTTPTGTTPGPTGQIGLTGVWKDDRGQTYSIRQVGNQIWWYMDGTLYKNVFKGNRSGNTITGEWCDVPGGRLEGNQTGALTLKIINDGRLEKVSASPPYGGSVWTRLRWDASP